MAQALIDYIRTELARGIAGDAITQSLIANGWHPEDIRGAFTALNISPEESSPTPVSEIVEPSREAHPLAGNAHSVLEEKAARIEKIYDATVSEVNTLSSEQRRQAADAMREFEDRKLDAVKKRLGL